MSLFTAQTRRGWIPVTGTGMREFLALMEFDNNRFTIWHLMIGFE